MDLDGMRVVQYLLRRYKGGCSLVREPGEEGVIWEGGSGGWSEPEGGPR